MAWRLQLHPHSPGGCRLTNRPHRTLLPLNQRTYMSIPTTSGHHPHYTVSPTQTIRRGLDGPKPRLNGQIRAAAQTSEEANSDVSSNTSHTGDVARVEEQSLREQRTEKLPSPIITNPSAVIFGQNTHMSPALSVEGQSLSSSPALSAGALEELACLLKEDEDTLKHSLRYE